MNAQGYREYVWLYEAGNILLFLDNFARYIDVTPLKWEQR